MAEPSDWPTRLSEHHHHAVRCAVGTRSGSLARALPRAVGSRQEDLADGLPPRIDTTGPRLLPRSVSLIQR